jgi:hypothetical protein
MQATEQQVEMAAQLYAARRSARIILGDRFEPVMADLGRTLKQIADAKKVSVLSAAILAAKGSSGMQAVQILAAAVELEEPSTARRAASPVPSSGRSLAEALQPNEMKEAL